MKYHVKFQWGHLASTGALVQVSVSVTFSMQLHQKRLSYVAHIWRSTSVLIVIIIIMIIILEHY